MEKARQGIRNQGLVLKHGGECSWGIIDYFLEKQKIHRKHVHI
jgi:hypothetical protein